MNTKSVGDATEAAVLAEFVKAGFSVSVPFGENQRYDLIVDASGALLRVQCKTGRLLDHGTVVCFNATSHDGHRARQGYRNQADLFAVYSPHTRQVYVLKVDEVGETGVYLRLTPGGRNNQYGIRYAEKHTLAAWAARNGKGQCDAPGRANEPADQVAAVVHGADTNVLDGQLPVDPLADRDRIGPAPVADPGLLVTAPSEGNSLGLEPGFAGLLPAREPVLDLPRA